MGRSGHEDEETKDESELRRGVWGLVAEDKNVLTQRAGGPDLESLPQVLECLDETGLLLGCRVC